MLVRATATLHKNMRRLDSPDIYIRSAPHPVRRYGVPYNLKVTNTPTRARFNWKFDMSKPNTAILLLLSIYYVVRTALGCLELPCEDPPFNLQTHARSCLVLRSGFRLQVRTYPVDFWCC